MTKHAHCIDKKHTFLYYYIMKEIRWDALKNEKLKSERGVCFELIETRIKTEQVLAILENANKNYQHQRIFVVEIDQYIYYAPFVESEEAIFLKTIIPSRKLTKQYQKKSEYDHE